MIAQYKRLKIGMTDIDVDLGAVEVLSQIDEEPEDVEDVMPDGYINYVTGEEKPNIVTDEDVIAAEKTPVMRQVVSFREKMNRNNVNVLSTLLFSYPDLTDVIYCFDVVSNIGKTNLRRDFRNLYWVTMVSDVVVNVSVANCIYLKNMELPFSGGIADLILCCGWLHMFNDKANRLGFLSEIKRCKKPNAQIILSVVSKKNSLARKLSYRNNVIDGENFYVYKKRDVVYYAQKVGLTLVNYKKVDDNHVFSFL